MTVIVAALVGYAGGRMLWLAMRKSWSRQAFMRTNYQGISLPTAAGIVLSLALLVVESARSIVAAAGIGDPPGLTSLRAAGVIVVLGFTLLGLLDDLVGSSGAKGFNGHFQALARGELTSGMVKLIGGAAAALIGAALVGNGGFGSLIINASIIALTANLFNLLDLRPGRATKGGIGLFAVLLITSGFGAELVPTAIVVGAAAAILLDDLHERLMLGDTGANALGAALGLGLVTQVSGSTQLLTLLVLIGLNVLSEFVSFSRLIDTLAPLRILDQLGRRHPPVIDLREDVFDSEPLAPFSEPFQSTSSLPPITRSPAGRGNVGGARGEDHIDPTRTASGDKRTVSSVDKRTVSDEPSDLFGVSENDFLSEHDVARNALADHELDHEHRHNSL